MQDRPAEPGTEAAGDPGERRVVMWGHLALLAVIAGVVLFYWFDARSVSLRANNLLLVQPGSIIALGLVLLVLPQCFPRVRADAPQAQPTDLNELGKVAALAAAFGALTISLETVGFDVATFLFMIVALYLCGERRWYVVLPFSAIFTLALIYGYGYLIPFPFPLSFL
jgi:hypothetical protein